MASEDIIDPPVQKYYHLPPQDAMSAVERVAYAMAAENHAGRTRDKAEGRIPEVYHLSLARNILYSVGVDNPMTLAIAWMHDMLEDCDRYNKLPPEMDADVRKHISPKSEPYHQLVVSYGKQKLRSDFTEKLIEAHVNPLDAHSIAELVTENVSSLTFKEYKTDSKPEVQTDKISVLSERAKLVKIADQLSSLIDDIHYTSGSKKPQELNEFFYKASSLIENCAGVNPLLDAVARVVTGQRPVVFDKFDFHELVDELKQKYGSTQQPDITCWVDIPNIHEANSGVISIGIDQSGRVSSYRILACSAPVDMFEQHPIWRGIAESRARVSNDLKKALNETTEDMFDSQTVIRFLGLYQDRFSRTYRLKHPMEVEQFLERCYETEALNKDTSHALEESLSRGGSRTRNIRAITPGSAETIAEKVLRIRGEPPTEKTGWELD